jgi:hypothetical protein
VTMPIDEARDKLRRLIEWRRVALTEREKEAIRAILAENAALEAALAEAKDQIAKQREWDAARSAALVAKDAELVRLIDKAAAIIGSEYRNVGVVEAAIDWLAGKRDQARQAAEQAQADAAAMRQEVSRLRPGRCSYCPGHWTGHSSDCPIGAALATNVGQPLLDELAAVELDDAIAGESMTPAEAKVAALEAELAAERAAKEAAERELSLIDAVMARRPALDQPTRWQNVEKAITTAARADAAIRERDEARAGYDQLDKNWEAVHSAAMTPIRAAIGNHDATVEELKDRVRDLAAERDRLREANAAMRTALENVESNIENWPEHGGVGERVLPTVFYDCLDGRYSGPEGSIKAALATKEPNQPG